MVVGGISTVSVADPPPLKPIVDLACTGPIHG